MKKLRNKMFYISLLMLIQHVAFAQPNLPSCDAEGNIYFSEDYAYPPRNPQDPSTLVPIDWGLDCHNYWLSGRVTIPQGRILRIHPGTIVRVAMPQGPFVTTGGINIERGSIEAIGDSVNQIVFRPMFFPEPGYHGEDEIITNNGAAILFRNPTSGASSDTSRFIWCNFQRLPIAITGTLGDNAATDVPTGLLTIDRCTFTDCMRGIGAAFGGNRFGRYDYLRVENTTFSFENPTCFGYLYSGQPYGWYALDIKQSPLQTMLVQPQFVVSNCVFRSDVPWDWEGPPAEEFDGFHFVRFPASRNDPYFGTVSDESEIKFCNFVSNGSQVINAIQDDEGMAIGGPTISNCYFYKSNTELNPGHNGRMPCRLFVNNLVHEDIFPDCDNSSGDENSIDLQDPDYEIRIVNPASARLEFDASRSPAQWAFDGINDGLSDNPTETDIDGTPLDIGAGGGPKAAPWLAYVELPNPNDSQRSLPNGLPAATYHVHGTYVVDHDIDIQPGTTLRFDETASLEFFNANTFEVSFLGTSALPIILEPFQLGFERSGDAAYWGGLNIFNCTVNLDYVEVRDAIVGLLLNSVVIPDVETGISLTITGCDVGLDATGCTVNLKKRSGGELSVSDNYTGINARLLSTLSLTGADVSDNGGGGINAYESDVVLKDCQVNHNGFAIPAIQGGVAMYAEANGFFRCTEITENNGPGIYNRSGTIQLSHFEIPDMWGGNDISNNSFFCQVFASSCPSFFVEQGLNRFSAQEPFSPLLWATNLQAPVIVDGNSWGYGAGQIAAIRERLYPPASFTLNSYNSSWTLCDEIPNYPDITSCDELWLEAVTDLSIGQYVDASAGFKSIMVDHEDCKYAKLAPEKYALTQVLLGTSYTTIRDTLLAEASTADSSSTKFALTKAAAIMSGKSGDYEAAIEELDSLANCASDAEDSIGCEMTGTAISFMQALSDTSDTVGYIAHYDSLLLKISSLVNALNDGMVYGPTIVWTDISTVDKLESSHEISADAYAEDDVPIEIMMIDYRFHPDGSWVHDTLEQQANDTTWEITLSLDSLGGGLEYRLLAIDTLGRVETWPGTEGYPNLNDTLTHFVSIEPRLTSPLTDTAYVYAPGVITEDLTIGDGGVLYIVPAPVALDSYVVAIDSGVGITLSGEEGSGVLVVDGTDSTGIVLDCSDPSNRWSGVSVQGGVLQASHATLREAVQPINAYKDAANPAIYLDNVTVSDYSLPVNMADVRTVGSDTSYIVDCLFENGDSSGVVIRGSDDRLIVESLTIRNCGDDGLVLSESCADLFSNVTITGNGRYGIFTDGATGNTVRLTNCYVAFNGDTLPEIKVNSYSTIDVSDYAGNTVKDSTGVLFECVEINDFDAELGSNSFVLADSTGKYFNVTSMSGPAYITGNAFYPETVNQTTFIDDYMKDDDLSSWVYSYLRAENQMDEVIEDPNGSIDFGVKAYVENYLGTVASDTITEVGFKFRLFPDSANWTTYRQSTVESDSLYDWSVTVGDQGGLVSYIWWAKDAHGRYLTSPADADTTTPDSGATHYLSFEVSDSVITNDSLTIWAPTTLTHDIRVGHGGRLVIKPWPGATDHTVTLAEGVSINISPTTFGNNPKMWVMGTESMPIILDAESDTS